jgi:hypothetical protein
MEKPKKRDEIFGKHTPPPEKKIVFIFDQFIIKTI